jgi:tRNA G46 methylase TrmB
VIDRKATLMRLPGMRIVSAVRSTLRAHWFDWRYHVKTCGEDDLRRVTVVGENASHAIPYIPTTPRTGRHILRNLPVTDVSNYTFIDIGSGKGRMLLLAAELPFRRVIGIEFASDLHAVAQQNVKNLSKPEPGLLSDRTSAHRCNAVRISARTVAYLSFLPV